jgi:hypothetical protein
MAQSNYFSQYHTSQELDEMTNTIRLFLTNATAQSNYFSYLHGGISEKQYLSQATNGDQIRSWPDNSNRAAAMKYSATLLLSSIDTNQIRLIYFKMTNLPAIIQLKNQEMKDGLIVTTLVTNGDIVSFFTNLVSQAISNLDEGASRLADTDMIFSRDGENYISVSPNSTNTQRWVFWSKDGPVRQFDKLGQYSVVAAQFYENGKLQEFRVSRPSSESIVFDTNGTLISFRVTENNVDIVLRPDATGNLKIRGFLKK